MALVAVIYHHFPHYRRPVMSALRGSEQNTYEFFSDVDDIDGIRAFRGDAGIEIHRLHFRPLPCRRFSILTGLREITDRNPDVVIILGNPNIVSTWFLAVYFRLKGVCVLFWAHGWLRRESRLKTVLRSVYYRLANGILVYGNRAKSIAEASGFPICRVRVIFNSLDWEQHSRLFMQHSGIPIAELRNRLNLNPAGPILLCISRLTQLCQYELLIEALGSVCSEDRGQLIFVGDGPQRKELEAMAASNGLSCLFLGAMYDEEVIAQYIMAADAVVSPGKVGLTAIHALSYGTPVVTHGDFDRQMPEVEAVQPGVSGELFEYGSSGSLLDAINRIIDSTIDRSSRRELCRSIIQRSWTPKIQQVLIDDAIRDLR